MTGLREQVEDFAEGVNNTLRSVLGDLVEPLEATHLGGTRFVVETAADAGLTLTKNGEPFLALRVRYDCGWDGPEQFTRVNRSEFHLIRYGETRPLIRYEYNHDAHRHRPIAQDADAVLVTDDGHRLGYVPRPLLEYVRPAMERHHELTVERVNPPAAGFHMRLLVRLAGHLPA